MKKTDPKWRVIEKVVALLEKSISPNARVEHDINLPLLASEGKNTRQCDTVIYEKEGPREMLTIVEVQDRKRKVEKATFDGWLVKKEEVGANRLICVSKAGFPESVIKQARRLGRSVVLMKIGDFGEKLPLMFYGESVWIYDNTFSDLKDPLLKVRGIKNPVKGSFKVREKIFEIKGTRYSINEVIQRFLNSIGESLACKTSKKFQLRVILPLKGELMFFYKGRRRYPVYRFEVTVNVETREHRVPLKVRSYEQIDTKTTLAWVVEAVGDIEGEEFDMRITFVPVGEGGYQMRFIKPPTCINGPLFLKKMDS